MKKVPRVKVVAIPPCLLTANNELFLSFCFLLLLIDNPTKGVSEQQGGISQSGHHQKKESLTVTRTALLSYYWPNPFLLQFRLVKVQDGELLALGQ